MANEKLLTEMTIIPKTSNSRAVRLACRTAESGHLLLAGTIFSMPSDVGNSRFCYKPQTTDNTWPTPWSRLPFTEYITIYMSDLKIWRFVVLTRSCINLFTAMFECKTSLNALTFIFWTCAKRRFSNLTSFPLAFSRSLPFFTHTPHFCQSQLIVIEFF